MTTKGGTRVVPPVRSRPGGRPPRDAARGTGAWPVMRCAAPDLPDVTLIARYEDLCAAFRDDRTFGNMSTKTTVDAHDAALSTMPRRPRSPGSRSGAPAVERRPTAEGDRIGRGAHRGDGSADRRVVRRGGRGRPPAPLGGADPLGGGRPRARLARVGLADDPSLGRVAAQRRQHRHARQPTRHRSAAGGVHRVRRRPGAAASRATRPVRRRALADLPRPDGTRFAHQELVHHVRTMLTAGNETTTSLMCNLV